MKFPIQVVTGLSNIIYLFYLFSYLYIKYTMVNNGTLHLKSPKNQNKRAVLGRSAIKLGGGGGGGGGLQPTLALNSALVSQTLSFSVCVEDS